MAWEYRSYVPSMNFYTIRVNKLLELAPLVPEEERISAIVPLEKYIKPEKPIKETKPKATTTKQVTTKTGTTKSQRGKTLVEGYINRNNQENRGYLNKPGNHANQLAYLLHCNVCGFEYEANGCDVAIRKCPSCM